MAAARSPLPPTYVAPETELRNVSRVKPKCGENHRVQPVFVPPLVSPHSPPTAANFEETGKAGAAWCRDGYPLWKAFPPLPHLTLPRFISLRRPPLPISALS